MILVSIVFISAVQHEVVSLILSTPIMIGFGARGMRWQQWMRALPQVWCHRSIPYLYLNGNNKV